jgi:hypothetical protein
MNKESPGQVNVGYNGFSTIWEQYQHIVKKFPERPFLGTRDKVEEGTGNLIYSWKTYLEIFEIMETLSRGKINKPL